MKKLITKGLFGQPCGITNGSLYLIESDHMTVGEIVKKHHYSHKTTKNRFLSFLVNDSQGVLQLGYGIRPRMKHTISSLITKDNYCEFDRMWLSDELPKNSESQVIALLISYLKQVHPRIKFVITYADESVGNTGVIYQATNAIRLGGVPVDFYVLENGERVHPVSMYHRHGTRARATLDKIYPNLKHIKGGFKQRRYLYILDKKVKKQYERLSTGQKKSP